MIHPLYSIPVQRIDGTDSSLAAYTGKVLLIVNVASQCGLTPQYAALERLYQSRRMAGLEVLGFPANDFGQQEPGSNAEILSFCTHLFDVHFPMFAKIAVTGEHRHPLYTYLTSAQPTTVGGGRLRELLENLGLPAEPPHVLWNFEKFLVSRSGEVIGRFAPDVTPEAPLFVRAIEAALATQLPPLTCC